MDQALSRSRTRGRRWRRAQASTIDFIVGFVVVVSAVIIAARALTTTQGSSTFEETKNSALAASDDLMSEGYPAAWNTTNVVTLGLLTDSRLNTTKLALASSMSPEELRLVLDAPPHIYFYFTNKTSVVNLGQCGYGDPSVVFDTDCTPTFDPERNLVRIDRFVAYQGAILRMVVVVWD